MFTAISYLGILVGALLFVTITFLTLRTIQLL
uniref:Cytochrome b6-f complex subunit 6 n=1 Tax=Chlorokybus atmophyticus TaxID=3144 RepID=PETL_CHLAT|nr:subunit VI of cytochrome b6/f complex [Chlorokybus atmophyticus]Q19V67.1 RecName: Full=Cytochrome b6-f complex subunit 6; AltName: Full=Cytochrome b6-f complex subunit PetL; AltName: Full=Cytochrome b6-f complex subunit VI [Chlorokybus atmophyticus]ABD62205.1 subunit VI of cytochrome b6/f complex [Chlorokybus atmophyticus]WKT05702.1 subunit VI of cytochrome b6/f complex [Chlorokybus atmophyticus]